VTTTEKSRSLGFAIYYWLVNMGALIGPTIAYFVRDSFGNEFVYLVSALSCLAMLLVNLFLYKEVKSPGTEVVETMGQKISNLFRVLGNVRFMVFLMIYSLYWIIFWQEFIIVPYYITDFISKEAPYEIIQSWAGPEPSLCSRSRSTVSRKMYPRTGPSSSGSRFHPHLDHYRAPSEHSDDRGRDRRFCHWRDDPGTTLL